MRDLCQHYAVWIRYRNGSEELRGRVNTRRFADQIPRDLRNLPENLLAEVYTVREFGVHPWTVRLRFRPLRDSDLETTLLGTQTSYSPAYTVDATTVRSS